MALRGSFSIRLAELELRKHNLEFSIKQMQIDLDKVNLLIN